MSSFNYLINFNKYILEQILNRNSNFNVFYNLKTKQNKKKTKKKKELIKLKSNT